MEIQCSHHLMMTIWLSNITGTHTAPQMMTHYVSVNIKKKSLFQWISLFWSIFQMYAFWVPISAVEGPHLVPISLKMGPY